MNKQQNPFSVSTYPGPAHFCDRETETLNIVEAILNKRNITLFSLRRMGKTGLAEHVGQRLAKQHGFHFLYSDIYHTYDTESLLTELTRTATALITNHKKSFDKLIDIFKRFRPLVGFDPITGSPQIELHLVNEAEAFSGLEELFQYLDALDQPICWALDEFQQISTYENEDSLYKLLRKITQRCRNIHFIFSGSHSNMLVSIFKKNNKPFYNSSQLLELKEIDREAYHQFIAKQFKLHKKSIDDEAIAEILLRTNRHTWYVQMLCNRLFQSYEKVGKTEVAKTILTICEEQEIVFYRYRQLMAKGQWNLLKAIALETKVEKITASEFIRKHRLGGSASVLKALTKLVKDEFVVQIFDDEKSFYRLNDVFLMIWIQIKYMR